MKTPRMPRAVDLILVIMALFCSVAAYTIHGQYIRAHVAADKAYQQARLQAAGDDEKYLSAIASVHLASPEPFYRRARAVAGWAFWVFCGAALWGLVARRWVAPAVALAAWVLAILATGARI